MTAKPTPDELQIWLEWAAAKLIAMPAGRLKPTEPRAFWPDYSQDKFQILEFRRSLKIRALAPSAAEIPVMDAIVLLPNLCTEEPVRKVVHWRAQIHPIRRSHLLTWTWISTRLDVRAYTAKRWHQKGLEEILVKASPETVCRIAAFMRDPAR